MSVKSGTTQPSEELITHNGYKLPEIRTLYQVLKLSIVEDKPIMMDYWMQSMLSIDKGGACIGVKDDNEKILVKSEDEYTSPISKIYKTEKEFIIVTENSIYLVDNEITKKKVSSSNF